MIEFFTYENVVIILLILILLSTQQAFIKRLRLPLLFKRSVVISTHFLSKFYPKNAKLVVFGGENGKGFRGNTKYLFMEMSKDPTIKCVWLTKDKDVINQLTKLGYEAYSHRSLKGIFIALRAKLIVHSHSINDDFNKVFVGGAISYNTWHGVGLKKVWGANENTYSYKAIRKRNPFIRFFSTLVARTNQTKKNYVVSTSPDVSSYYPETFMIPKENVLELGQVRNDVFFKETEEDLEVPEWIRKEKIILYMPTHRKLGKLDPKINDVFNFKMLDAYCKRKGYKFVVKRHMYSKGNVPKLYDNIIDISDETYDPQLLLKYADILMTDYSSCYTDYLFLDRPVLFYSYDLDDYLEHSNQMYFDYFEVTPGPKAMDFDELLSEIELAIENPRAYKDERERVFNIFYSESNQGEVLQKQVDFLKYDILKLK